ncbi:hypothetical protein J6590_003543 [Homalodisca vitripennis]|nr:hypothetical protein J6590_003543 [Homalodisca vitripennis]
MGIVRCGRAPHLVGQGGQGRLDIPREAEGKIPQQKKETAHFNRNAVSIGARTFINGGDNSRDIEALRCGGSAEQRTGIMNYVNEAYRRPRRDQMMIYRDDLSLIDC